jgi:lipoyl synthase
MAIQISRRDEKPAKPPWLKVKAPGSPEYMKTRETVKTLKLHTVCEEAKCPNIGECWSHHTATFMIMGDLCTRKCHFCSVKKGDAETLMPLDPFEPERVGIAVKELGLKHAVITSVDRDDHFDNGASHFAKTVAAIKKHAPGCKIELLIPDLQGSKKDLETIIASGIQVLNHNVETVPRLYKKVRPGAGYVRSLSILRWAKEFDPSVLTKSGIMVGLGEEKEEVLALMDDLRYCNVDIMTIGQYLRPTERQLPVKAFVTPEEFKEYEEAGLSKGFKFVESGALVRSSYHAWKHTEE